MRCPAGKRLPHVVELQAHPVPAAGLERRRVLVAVPVGEVEEPVADPRGRAVGRDVGEARRDQRQRAVDGQHEVGDRRAEQLDARRQGIGVEHQRAAVLEPLVERQVRRERRRGTSARRRGRRSAASGGPAAPRARGRPRGARVEHTGPRRDARGRPGRLRAPSARARSREGARPGRRVLDPDPEQRLVVDPGARGP